jgi:hypothetical protein
MRASSFTPASIKEEVKTLRTPVSAIACDALPAAEDPVVAGRLGEDPLQELILAEQGRGDRLMRNAVRRRVPSAR